MERINAIASIIYASVLTVLYVYNFCMFFIKKKKYKQVLQVTFYIVALFAIVVNIVTAWADFDCNQLDILLHQSLPYFTLTVGNYLAGSIKILSLQLEQLIASKDEVLMIQDPDQLTFSGRIKKLNDGKKRVYTIFWIFQVTILIIFVLEYGLTIDKELDIESCQTLFESRMMLINKSVLLILTLATILWVTIPACQLNGILKSKMNDISGFRQELCKIHCTNLIFILSIVYQSLVFVTRLFIFQSEINDTKLLNAWYDEYAFITVTIPSLFPIMIVLINHFKSLHSINRIFKVLWIK